MPTALVGHQTYFHYSDSGPPAEENYPTLVIIHGYAFHGGIFSRITKRANHHGLRIISVNRRGYPGSSSFSEAELRVINEGTATERETFILQEGVLYCRLIDRLIEELSLPKEHGLTVAGWSMGNIFTLALMTAVARLPEDASAKLKAYVRRVLLWDPPVLSIGGVNPAGAYFPLFDQTLTIEERGKTFGVWVSSYFKHGTDDPYFQDFDQLNQNDPDPSRQSTILKMTMEEIAASTDFRPGPICDMPLLSAGFASILFEQTNKALFSPLCRKEWGSLDVLHLFGTANSWIVVYSAGLLKKRSTGKELRHCPIEGANHFPMWDEPERMLLLLKEIVEK